MTLEFARGERDAVHAKGCGWDATAMICDVASEALDPAGGQDAAVTQPR